MKATVKENVLLDGTVSEVSFTGRDRVSVKFGGEENFAFEFTNNRKPRADHVRKLRIQKGDHVIAIGGKYGSSNIKGAGFEIMRTGKIADGESAIIRGEIGKSILCGTKILVYLKTEDGKEFLVLCDSEKVKNAKQGMMMSCLCTVKESLMCACTCKQASTDKCPGCVEKKTQKQYNALDVQF